MTIIQKTILNIIAFFALSLLLTQCSFLGLSRAPSSSSLPKHYIVTVHGLGGGEHTFGHLADALVLDLKKSRPEFDYVSVPVSYYNEDDKKGDDFNGILFSQRLGDQLVAKFADSPLNDGDKISIVVHSQGGLVTVIWYFNSKNKFGPWEKYHEISKHVDKFITLGTPFWGSKLAYAVTAGISQEILEMARLRSTNALKKLNYVEKIGIHLVKKYAGITEQIVKKMNMSSAELVSMNFGSFLTHNFRQAIVDRADSEGKIKLDVEVINIAGIAPNRKFIKDKVRRGGIGTLKGLIYKPIYRYISGNSNNNYSGFGFGHKSYESDGAVLVPSSRLDFIYAADKNKTYKAGTVFARDQFRDIKHINKDGQPSPFHMVHTLHASPNWERVFGIASLPYKCLPRIRTLHKKYASQKTIRMDWFVKAMEKQNPADVKHFQKIGCLPRDKFNDPTVRDEEPEIRVQSVERKRLDLFNCDHPTYNLIFDYLSDCHKPERKGNVACRQITQEIETGRKRYEQKDLEDQMRGFTVDINIEIPRGYKALDGLKPVDFFKNFIQYVNFDVESPWGSYSVDGKKGFMKISGPVFGDICKSSD